jgi:hypothetical protein
MAMLQYTVSRLAATLLAGTVALGSLLPNTPATASEKAEAPAKTVDQSPSSRDVPATSPARYLKLEDICRVQGEGQSIFTKDGKLTLVLHQQFAGYRAAQHVAEALNGPQVLYQNNSRLVAKALDSANIEVDLPPQYRDDHVAFISQILSLTITEPEFQLPVAFTSPRPTSSSPQPPVPGDPLPPEPQWSKGTTIKDVCRVKGEDLNIFTADGNITLALHQHHASYQKAQDVASSLNTPPMIAQNEGKPLATALDQTRIEVSLPPQYRDAPVAFISQALGLPLSVPNP